MNKNDSLLLGKQAPEFTATTLSGKVLHLLSLRGKIVVLNFWFSGCPPCLKEIDMLNDLVKKYKHKKVVFIAISVVDKTEKLKQFLKRIDFNYQVALSDSSIIRKYKVKLYPTNIIISSNGLISFRESGFNKKIGRILSDEIEKCL